METNIRNKCKAYTSLEQSKKLAKILPLESADMKWYFWKSEIDAPKLPTFGYSKDAAENYKSTEAVYLPCWSLAALLDILYQVKEIKHQRVTILVGGFAGQQWYVEFVKVQDEKSVLLEHSKELVDACYEMIIKLHELNLL